ncbi:hypothetical protein AC579_1744 [Pseudocercospora musae]|uniref:Dihydroorotate dehydrogenase catalytic domain-containing protein n=1 Tax=Pseudocercospora musae TaxID=113226 RepID=A0A139IF17_9PEZI|nr:hypothetical protein AC579_1744 [Pseudocercospora musae]
MEINLSCPNIPSNPPPAYSSSIWEYLTALAKERSTTNQPPVAIRIKTPPYTYHDQFQILIDALSRLASRPVLLTSSRPRIPWVQDDIGTSALGSASELGIGGMAGAPIHPLASGNVKTIRRMLDDHEQLQGIDIIGIGGVSDDAGFQRLRAVGANVVAVGTALGCEGVAVFEKILGDTSNR